MTSHTEAEALLDEIDRWLRDAPTHPHIQYGMAFGAMDPHAVSRIKPMVVETWDSLAMLAEWDNLRERLAGKP